MVDTADGRYSFVPTTCVIHHEGEQVDAEVGGPGTAPDGEKIYVEFGSTANELSIGLGVDTPFTSSDRTLKAGEFVSSKMQVETSGKTIRVADMQLIDNQGNSQLASLEIEC